MESINTLPINILDIGVALTLLISGVLAYARGLVHEVLSLGGWIGAAFSTYYFYYDILPIARDLISIRIVADLGAGIVIFIVTLVIFSLITRAISSRIKESALNALDRALGFLFGLARGALLLSIAYLGLEFFVPKSAQPEWVTSAKSMPIIREGASILLEIIPDNTNIILPKIDTKGASQNIIQLIEPKAKNVSNDNTDGYSDTERENIQRLFEKTE